MTAVLSPGSALARFIAVSLAGTVMVCVLAASLLPALGGCPRDGEAAPSATAERTIPPDYLALYAQAGAAYGVPWPLLAAIGAIESDHGRSTAPGVHSGVNAFGCCAGPMQFNLKNGPPSTWQTYRVDGDADGDLDPYDPADAIASAARYLRVLLDGTHGDLTRAVYGYNHSRAYVDDVLARARAYHADPALAASAVSGDRALRRLRPTRGPSGRAELRRAERRERPTRVHHAAGLGDGRRTPRAADRRTAAGERAVAVAHVPAARHRRA